MNYIELLAAYDLLEAERDTLKQQNAELAAQVEVFRKALEYADNKLYILTHNRDDVSARLIGDADKAFKVVRDTLSQSSTPAQCLLEVKAEAVSMQAKILRSETQPPEYRQCVDLICDWIDSQANKMRGGE